MPNWLRNLLEGLLLILGLLIATNWVLAPLLDAVPAYVLFGLIFLVPLAVAGVYIWWKWPKVFVDPGKRSLWALFKVLLLFAWIWGSFTLALYGYTLNQRHDGAGNWWLFAGLACFGILALIGWLGMRADKRKGVETGE